MTDTVSIKEPSRHFLSPLWAVFAILVLAVPGAALLWSQPPPLDNFGPIPEFSLTDQDAQPFTRSTMAGTVWVADFIFTRCPDICPTLSSRLATLQPQITSHQGDQPIKLLSFSVDPAYDTPTVLTDYGAQFQAIPEHWRFITGEEPQVYAAIEGFKQAVDIQRESGREIPDILHSQKFVLIDGDGDIRGFYSSEPDGLDALWRAAAWLSNHPED